MTFELSRPIPLSRIARSGLAVIVEATSEECAAVAARMDLPAIGFLVCSFDLTAEDDSRAILARGHLRASVTRICVVSAEEFETPVEDEFEIRFVPAGQERDDYDPNWPDEIPYDSNIIDVGDAAAEQLSLALDPNPRMDGATMPRVEGDDEGSPFAGLSRWSASDKTRS